MTLASLTAQEEQRLTALRQEFAGHIEGIQQRIAALTQALAGSAPHIQRDLESAAQSALHFSQFSAEKLQPYYFHAQNAAFDDTLQIIRHDLRNLLNNILGRAQLLQLEDGLDQAAQDVLQELCQACRHCVDVLRASRPTAEPAAAPQALELPPPPPPVQPTAAGEAAESATILIIDDSQDSREQLQRFLQKEGHQVRLSHDAAAALDFLSREDVDLILLDLHMPGMNGFEFLTHLRLKGTLGHTPVIIVSGMDFETHAVRGIELGALDYLSRPVDLSLLRARVNAALERQRLRQREFAQYFSTTLARQMMRRPELLQVGRKAEVSVLFIDIVGFSSVSERLGPIQTLSWLSEAMGTFSECIHRHSGVLVDYTGDQIMALWGAPQEDARHADHACEAALGLLDCLPAIDAAWQAIIGRPTKVTIGVNTGEAFVGNIGTQHKFKYGALGNTVNLASRLQSATKYLRVPLVISGHTRALLTRPPLTRRLTRLRVKNIAQPVEVLQIARSTDPAVQHLYEVYEQALELYEQAEFHQAGALLGELLKHHPQDGPTALLLSRAVNAIIEGGDAPHDPVWTLPGK